MIKKFLGIKKIIAGVLSVVLFTGAVVISPDILPSTIEVSASTATVVANDSGGININGFRDGKYEALSGDEVEVFGEEAEDILKVFGLDKIEHSYWNPTWRRIYDSASSTNYPYYEIWRDENGSNSIPNSYRTSIQIKNATKADRIYLGTNCEKYLTLTNKGVLTANYTNEFDVVEYDNAEMRIYYNNKYVKIYLDIYDYDTVIREQWVKDIIAEYMDSHTNNSMSDYEKMEVALKWLQTFPYECPGTSVYAILKGIGGGDCWTYPDFITYIADYMGWKSKIRWATIDLGATNTHKNSSVELDGKIYIVDIGTSSRHYDCDVMEDYTSKMKTGYKCSNDGFVYKEYSKGVEIVQYLGFDENVVVPDTINGKPVSIIDNYTFDYQSTYPIHSLIVPDSVVGRILGDLPYSPNVHVETASGTVLQEGLYNADGSVKTVDVSELYIYGIATDYDYTGKAVKPEPIVLYPYSYDGTGMHLKNIKLTKNVDYTVSYSNNVKVGTATITIKGLGDYAGTVSKTFDIVDNSIDETITENNTDIATFETSETIQQETAEETTYISKAVTTTTKATTQTTTQTITQTTVKATENSENTTEATVISGDANEDGKLDSRDAVVVLKDFAGQMVGIKSTLDLAISDMNNDGKINSTDAVIILKTYAQNLIHN